METHLLNWEQLRAYCQKLLQTQGMPEDEALTVADSLVWADLCGVESHGVSRMTIYTKRLEEKVVNAVCQLKVEQEYAASIAINGCNSMGIVVSKKAMEKCIEKAKQSGSCFVTVNNSNHNGMAYYFVKMAADQGMFGFSVTNAPPNIAPWGSAKPYHGTNPIAFAAPTNEEPVILDMAPSLVAMGKVILAAKLGKPSIPEGWALDSDGKPTTDPKEGVKGSVVPIGGPKGSGLTFFVDVICGILAGAKWGPHLGNLFNDFVNPQNVGHAFACIDISKFIPLETFKERLGQMKKEIKALPKQEGVSEIFMPGEIEWKKMIERKETGVPVPEPIYNELKQLGEKYNVPFTL